MGMYFRKSFGFGPVRFNLSGSGVGASVGVPGFRVGINARGQSYIHAGAGGVYYRTQLGERQSGAGPQNWPGGEIIVGPASHTHGPMMSHGSVHHGNAADELTTALSKASTHISYLPLSVLFLLGSIGLLIYVVCTGSADLKTFGWILLLVLAMVAGWVACVLAWHRDKRELVSLKYDLDSESAAEWRRFATLIASLQGSGVKLLKGAADVYNSKYHSGAGRLVDTGSLPVCSGFRFKSVECNIMTPAIEPVAGVKYVFLPDRIIVIRHGRLSRIDYSDLLFNTGSTTIIEERAPAGATVVGHSWRFTNKDGGPDRRFNNNYQLPIVEYNLVRIGTEGGMDHALLFVSKDIATHFVRALTELRSWQANYSRMIPAVSDEEPRTPRALLSPPSSAIDDQEQATSAPNALGDPYDAALDAICCVMFADGKCSVAERKAAVQILARMKCPMNSGEIEARVTQAWEHVRSDGFQVFLSETEAKLSSIETDRQKAVLQKCLQEIAKADGKVEKSEKAAYRRLVEALKCSVASRS